MSNSAHNMRHFLTRFLAVFCALMVLSAPAWAEEVIRSFSSNVTLLDDGSVDVVENIEVRAEGSKIRRGIFRDIPTLMLITNDEGGESGKLRSRLTVIDVQRNGKTEPWFTEGITNGTRVYIGQSDVFLPRGNYRYTIHYTMTRIARRFADYDELYWNATGNFWDFPIEEAVATITLPTGARIDSLRAYTGKFGSSQSAATVSRNANNVAVFRAARPLEPYEGMSIAVSFQKNVLAEPDLFEKFANYLSDYRESVLPAAAVFLVLLYYLFAWDAVGRDPEKGTIIPLFHPPHGFSPALTHYIWGMGWKKNGWQAFTSALISLATKNLIDISKTGKKTTMTVVGDSDQIDLPPGEAAIFAYLDSRGSVTINKTTGPTLNTKRAEFISVLETENRHVYFHNNYVYVIAGVVMSILCLVALTITGALAPEWLVVSVIGGILIGTMTGVMRALWTRGGVIRYFQLAVMGFFGVNFATGLAGSFSGFGAIATSIPPIAAASIIAINIVFAIIMRAPTVQGRKVMDQIDGFRMYLDTAEKERLNFVGEPEMSVARFESILPYAIALGVEKPWTERFEGELSRHAISDARSGYSPNWYHGSNFSSSTLSRDVTSLASGMSAAMIAAQPSTSSSSGSSGGGSSGGGGGGGGGGGW